MTEDPGTADGTPLTGGRSSADSRRTSDGHRSAGDPSPGTGSDPDHWVYVLRCADGTLYTGYTTDVGRRVAEHDDGDGAKYTRGRTPVDLVHAEGFDSRSAALSREHEIKALPREEKERLIE